MSILLKLSWTATAEQVTSTYGRFHFIKVAQDVAFDAIHFEIMVIFDHFNHF